MTNLHLIKILNEKLLGKKVKFQFSINNFCSHKEISYEEAKEINGGVLINNNEDKNSTKYTLKTIIATHTIYKFGEIVEICIKGYEIELKLLVDGKHTRKVYFGMDEELEAIDDETYIVIY